jgi:fatty-acid desaturase
MAYENELFFGSLVVLFSFLAYRLVPKLNAAATREPLASPAWALSTNELLVCAALLALTLLSFVLFTKKRHVLREQRRRARKQTAKAGAGDSDDEDVPNQTPEPFVCTVPSLEDYKNDPELRVPMWKRLRWPMVVYLGGRHALAVYWVLHVALGADTTRAATYAFGFVLWALGGLGITAGAHRLWSHRSYKAAWPLRVLLLVINSMANQGSAIHWSRDHRTHHLFSDTMSDPYDASRGFFFSHVGWLLLRKHSRVLKASRRFVSVADLWADPLLALQERLDPWWNLTFCFVLPTLAPVVLWGEGAWNAYMVAGVVKYLLTLHITWSVNSVVHKWGRKPYNRPRQLARRAPRAPRRVAAVPHARVRRARPAAGGGAGRRAALVNAHSLPQRPLALTRK